MARTQKPKPTAPLEELLARAAEVTLLLDTGHRIPVYAGETLPEAARRAQREAPGAKTARVQGYLNRHWTYAGPFPLEELARKTFA